MRKPFPDKPGVPAPGIPPPAQALGPGARALRQGLQKRSGSPIILLNEILASGLRLGILRACDTVPPVAGLAPAGLPICRAGVAQG